jgi:hypothetical protein
MIHPHAERRSLRSFSQEARADFVELSAPRHYCLRVRLLSTDARPVLWILRDELLGTPAGGPSSPVDLLPDLAPDGKLGQQSPGVVDLVPGRRPRGHFVRYSLCSDIL